MTDGDHTSPRRLQPAKKVALALLTGFILAGGLWYWAQLPPPPPPWNTLEVTATAYNSVPGQTTATDHDIAAWGDKLVPGMKAIAVSRDLLDLGLTHGIPVRIEGLEGEFLVLDKMNKRWKKKIDIYMGEDLYAAREWGRRTVVISWPPDPIEGIP